ncbi:MAG: helix-turn-helix transcriptional regulator [Eubacterium sp.]|nr:helix-turn-helix transcriptional regulator [Eubacterium sp.]
MKKSKDNCEMKNFRIHLARIRLVKGLSAREVSLRMGKSEGYINSIENGYFTPPMDFVFQICGILEITPPELFLFQ